MRNGWVCNSRRKVMQAIKIVCYTLCWFHNNISEFHSKEVFFPGEYTLITHDGNYPQNGWSKVASPLKQSPIFDEREKTTIPIVNVRHATHSEQARDISRANYSFKPKPKFGKVYDGSKQKGTYKKVSEGEFQRIEHGERVIEGNLSWWGVDTHLWYQSDDAHLRSKEFASVATTLRSERVFVSPFMSKLPASPYGNHGFIVGFKDLLKCYQESRTDIAHISDRALFLRIGGTLRYRYEICYVVIVCTKQDQELEHYPSLYTRHDIFDHKELLHPSGQIEENFFTSEESIDLKIRYAIKCVPVRQYFSYETSAFAFYYPQTSTNTCLKCNPDSVQEVAIEEHKCNRLCHEKNAEYLDELLLDIPLQWPEDFSISTCT